MSTEKTIKHLLEYGALEIHDNSKMMVIIFKSDVGDTLYSLGKVTFKFPTTEGDIPWNFVVNKMDKKTSTTNEFLSPELIKLVEKELEKRFEYFKK